MKRIDLIKHIEQNGCCLLRDGGKHTIYFNPSNNQTTSIPRHREIDEYLSRKICRDLGIEKPK